MTKRRVALVAAFLGVVFGVKAQQMEHSNRFGSLHWSPAEVPSLSLADSKAYPFGSAFAWADTTPVDFLPNWKPDGWPVAPLTSAAAYRDARPRAGNNRSVSYSQDSSKEVVAIGKSNLLDNVHGEVGFLYGRSSGGRYSRDVESGYIFGTAGDDKLQISVGAFYENSNIDFSRRGR